MSPRLRGGRRPRPRRTNFGGARRRTGREAPKATAESLSAPLSPRAATVDDLVRLPANVSVSDLATRLDASAVEVIKELMMTGVMASINQTVDYETAALVAESLGRIPRLEEGRPEGAAPVRAPKVEEGTESRPPIVTILGHVDHGKTSLLDKIRQANVAGGEAGGITQHIGAYQVEVDGHRITFVDTPGHEAFTQMRARGANVTDIAVVLIAADDGVMPQTLEAINHAKAAGVPIVVVINKIDRPDANPDRVKQQLTEHELVVEEYGGDVVAVPVSAQTGEGVDTLLENLELVAELGALRADPTLPATGVVLESELDASRGPVAHLLVRDGTLRSGVPLLAGSVWGKVRAMFDEHGQRIAEAGPSTPVEILGFSAVPEAGTPFEQTATDQEARARAEKQRRSTQSSEVTTRGASLTDLYSQIIEGAVHELNVILKTDVFGSIEPIRASLERLGSEEVGVRILHAAAGRITESDVTLALASKGVVVGFNTGVDAAARRLANAEKVDVRLYTVIYRLTEEMERAVHGLLTPTEREVIDGHAEVRAVFGASRLGKVAGIYVTDGHLTRNSTARVVRNGAILWEARLVSLRRFKEDVREVASGYEGGLGIEGFNGYREGDVIEAFHKELS